METVLIPRVVQVVLKDGGTDLLFYQLFINGEVGTIWALNGRGMKLLDMAHFKYVAEQTGLKILEAVMSPRVLSLLEKSLPEGIGVTKFETHTMEDGLQVQRIQFSFGA